MGLSFIIVANIADAATVFYRIDVVMLVLLSTVEDTVSKPCLLSKQPDLVPKRTEVHSLY